MARRPGGASLIAEKTGERIDGVGEQVAVLLIKGIGRYGIWSQVDVKRARSGICRGANRIETNSRKEPETGTRAPAAALIWKDSTVLSPGFSLSWTVGVR